MKNKILYTDHEFLTDLFDGIENPFDEAEKKLKNKMVSSLSELNQEEYLVLSLYHEEEMINYKEIGQIMSINDSDAYKIHQIAMLKMQSKLQPNSNKI